MFGGKVTGVFQFEQGDDLTQRFPGFSVFNCTFVWKFDVETTGTNEKKQASSDKIMPLFHSSLTNACHRSSCPLSLHIAPSSTLLISSQKKT